MAIELIGVVKAVNVKAKVNNDDRLVHHLEMKLELAEGAEHVEEVIGHLREIVHLTIDPKQPHL